MSTSHHPPLRAFAGGIVPSILYWLLSVTSPFLRAQDSGKRSFDLPADVAEKTFPLFSEQSGCGLIASTDLIKGIKTNAVQGEFAPREALDQMLAGTGLVAEEDKKSGAFTVHRGKSDPNAQGVAQTSDRSHPAQDPSSETATGPAGAITGQVIDEGTKQALQGVIVKVAGTQQQIVTNAEGAYTLVNIAPGEVTLDFSYLGYASQEQSVRVGSGQVASLDVVLSPPVVKLEGMVVSGTALGTARGINEQRTASSLTNVLAEDAIGQLPDMNSAEAVERLPGVTTEGDRGEQRYIIVNGIDSEYVGVAMDGLRVAPSESKGTRDVAMDIIPSSAIDSIEVTEVSTPDMYPDSMGANVDIRTRTGFEANGPQAVVSGDDLYSSQEKRHGYDFEAFFGTPLDHDKIGIFFGAQHEYRPFSSFYATETTPWTQVVSPNTGQETWVIGGLDLRHYELSRVRDSENGSFEYKLGDTGKIYVQAVTAWTIERNNQQLMSFPLASGTFSQLNATSGTESLTKVVESEEQISLDKRTSAIVAGFDQTVGPWTFNVLTGWTLGKYARAQPLVQYQTSSAGTLQWDDNNPYTFDINQTGGASIFNPNSYAFSTKSSYSQTISIDKEKSIGGDVRYDLPFSGELPTFLKAGTFYRNLNKSIDVTSIAFGTVPFTMAQMVQPDLAFNGMLPGAIRLNPAIANGYYLDPAAYDPTFNASKSYLGDCQATENVTAGYVMGDTKFGKFELLAGIRLERTLSDVAGWQQDSTTGLISPVTGMNKVYGNVFPDVILTYRLDPQTTVRASYTTNISRPPFDSEIPGRTVDDTSRTVTEGNPGLEPLLDTNYDASIEHYFSSLGILAGNVFYKNIKNFTYEAVQGTDPTTGYTLETYFNGSAASIEGLEGNWQQRFTFLPSPLDGLGVNANVTFMNSSSSYPTRPGENLPFVGMSKLLYNTSLIYEKSGLKLRFAVNYYSQRLASATAIGVNYDQDMWEAPWVTCSFGSSYLFAQHWDVFINVDNLFNSPYREHSGGPDGNHLEAWEKYGWTSQCGVRWTL